MCNHETKQTNKQTKRLDFYRDSVVRLVGSTKWARRGCSGYDDDDDDDDGDDDNDDDDDKPISNFPLRYIYIYPF